MKRLHKSRNQLLEHSASPSHHHHLHLHSHYTIQTTVHMALERKLHIITMNCSANNYSCQNMYSVTNTVSEKTNKYSVGVAIIDRGIWTRHVQWQWQRGLWVIRPPHRKEDPLSLDSSSPGSWAPATPATG